MGYPVSYRKHGRERSSSQGGAKPKRVAPPLRPIPRGVPGVRRPLPGGPGRRLPPLPPRPIPPAGATGGGGKGIPGWWGWAFVAWATYEEWARQHALNAAGYWRLPQNSAWTLVNTCNPSQVVYNAASWAVTFNGVPDILSSQCLPLQAFTYAGGNYPFGNENYDPGPGYRQMVIWDGHRSLPSRWANRFTYNRGASDTGAMPRLLPPWMIPQWFPNNPIGEPWSPPVSNPWNPFAPPLGPQFQPRFVPFRKPAVPRGPEGPERENDPDRKNRPKPKRQAKPIEVIPSPGRGPRPRPRPRPNPRPGPGPTPNPGPGVRPSINTVIRPDGSASTRLALHRLRAPRGKERETKVRGKFAQAVMIAVNIFGEFTEAIDLMDNIYEALPQDGKRRSIEERMGYIYHHYDQIDWWKFIRNYIKSQVGDMAVGLQGQANKWRYQQTGALGSNQIGGSRLTGDPWREEIERRLKERGLSWSPSNVSDAAVDIIFEYIEAGGTAFSGQE